MTAEYNGRALWDLEEGALETLREFLAEGTPDEDAIYERIQQIAEDYTPVYNWDLAELLLNNLGLGFPEDFEWSGCTDIWSAIRWSVYEHLTERLNEKREELQAELVEAAQELSDDTTVVE